MHVVVKLRIVARPLTGERHAALRAFDRYARRLDEVRFRPAYHQLMTLAMDHGIHDIAWREEHRPGAPGRTRWLPTGRVPLHWAGPEPESRIDDVRVHGCYFTGQILCAHLTPGLPPSFVPACKAFPDQRVADALSVHFNDPQLPPIAVLVAVDGSQAQWSGIDELVEASSRAVSQRFF